MVDQNEAYTFQKRGIYYFSRRVPSDLKDLYKVERLTYSLKTKCPKLAKTQVKDSLQKLEWYRKEKVREEKEHQEKLDREREEELKRVTREKAKKKYDKIYNACLLKKSLGVDMQVSSVRNAVEKTCEDIATNPSWLDEWRYN